MVLGEPDDGFRWLTLPAHLESLETFRQFVREGARGAAMSDERFWQLDLALEEALVNVVRYAYPRDTRGEVRVGWHRGDSGGLTIVICDSGREFDPLSKAPPDLTADLEDRPIGGLGIHLIRQIAASVEYRRAGGMNRLTFEIR
jgi:anti-sigma regulatory factor (Ser/Thr protein kinase)